MIFGSATTEFLDDNSELDRSAVPVLKELLDLACRTYAEDEASAKQQVSDEDMRSRMVPDHRKRIAEAFGRITDPQAVPDLLAMLQNATENAYCDAAFRGIARIGPAALPQLLPHVETVSGLARGALMESLLACADPDSVSAVISIVGRQKTLEALVRVFRSFWKPGHPAERIRDIMSWQVAEYFLNFADHDDEFVRSHVPELLGEIGDSRAIPLLIELLNDETHVVRESASTALTKLAGPTAPAELADVLCGILDHYLVPQALTDMGASAVPALTRALKNDSPEIVVKAVRALASIGTDEAFQAIESVRSHESEAVRDATDHVLAVQNG